MIDADSPKNVHTKIVPLKELKLNLCYFKKTNLR